MPAFVKNGPDIPESLLQEHEDGRVVFFCGAGISYPAGLPDFQGLVCKIYKHLGTKPDEIEEVAHKACLYDRALHCLELRYPGGRIGVRKSLAEVLRPKRRGGKTTATHKALIELSTDRNGTVKLVTTNFDQIFSKIIKKNKFNIQSFKAPLLPIPKLSHWNGIVYLHGLLPTSPVDETALNQLVLTSGDFGLAYLTERWAARFVSELFCNYTVCFVGYSINDPVLRYMMDALAADTLRGESRKYAYLFGSFNPGNKNRDTEEWKSKGVIPMLYEVHDSINDHSVLHQTLKAWAEIYRDGIRGKEMIIVQEASKPPTASSPDLDFAVGRVLWALQDESAAKCFADLSPTPPIEWLDILSKPLFKYANLKSFGIVQSKEIDKEIEFSFLRRLTPPYLAPFMCVADHKTQVSYWDGVMLEICRWLINHLDDPKLLHWIARQGGQLHDIFSREVNSHIDKIDKWTREQNHTELEFLRAKAPHAIPSTAMRTLWRLFLTKRIKTNESDYKIYDWVKLFEKEGLTPTLRVRLHELLIPRITLNVPFQMNSILENFEKEKSVKNIARCEVVLSCNHVSIRMQDLNIMDSWHNSLPDLLQNFTLLLKDALDLMRELDDAGDYFDLSYIYMPSISEHAQNRGFAEWTYLIELTRDAWVATAQKNPELARLFVYLWWKIPYPTFKRLTFFAAANSELFSLSLVLDWLTENEAWWLWATETQREVMQILAILAPKLILHEQEHLIQTILSGPPRKMFKEDIEQRRYEEMVTHMIWLRLSQVQKFGGQLGDTGTKKILGIKNSYPQWKISDDERDEFPTWMSIGNDGRQSVSTPRSRSELSEWLKQNPDSDHFNPDDWQNRCRNNFSTASCALYFLAKSGNWPIKRWIEALQVWISDEFLLKRSWRYAKRIFDFINDKLLLEFSASISWWLHALTNQIDAQEDFFFAIVQRLFSLQYPVRISSGNIMFDALNHPIGQVTGVLLDWWYRQNPQVGGGLSEKVKELFSRLCDTKEQNFLHARVRLASNVLSLFRVDELWTRAHLLPLFDWKIQPEIESLSVWQGFLFSPQRYNPLLVEIREPLLETVAHYDQLGEYAERYVTFMTFIALDMGDTFEKNELQEVFNSLSEAGLIFAAQAVVRVLEEGVPQYRSKYFRDRVLPFFKHIWPANCAKISTKVSEELCEVCIISGDEFPNAIDYFKGWIKKTNDPGHLIHKLQETNICKQYPNEALTLLDAMVSDSANCLDNHFMECLNSILNCQPNLDKTPHFQRLSSLYKRIGFDQS